jgi:CubicO group peptidase (beta-lactamase class C family)
MPMMRRLLLGLLLVLVVAIGGLAAFLVVAPPDLLRVATGYSAKIVCSNHFIAGRDPASVLAVDVQAPGHPILKLVKIGVDDTAQTVTARFLGLFATSIALYRPGLGCASVPDGDVVAARNIQLASQPVITPPGDEMWPLGDRVETTTTPALGDILADAALVGPQMRAIVVVRDGKIIAETYGPGFDAATPLLGWSMTKTVNAALLGLVMTDDDFDLDERSLVPSWSDGRKDIRLRDMAGMASGLIFNEEYGDVSDVNRMLFLEPDMSKFAGSLRLAAAPGTVFNYSSGTATILSRFWMDRLGGGQAALTFPRTALFGPLGMTSAVMETDERGRFVGSSYMYATARDWARFGLFLLQDGVWNGARLLPEGFVKLMATSNGLPGGYAQMQSWVLGPHESEPGEEPVGLPADTFWLQGHDGQSVTVIPSAGLVVVRLGLTPWNLD